MTYGAEKANQEALGLPETCPCGRIDPRPLAEYAFRLACVSCYEINAEYRMRVDAARAMPATPPVPVPMQAHGASAPADHPKTSGTLSFVTDGSTASGIPMLLVCPACCARHVDRGEFAAKPHHTHACQSCGMVWRPALVFTVGVDFLPGFRDPPRCPACGDATHLRSKDGKSFRCDACGADQFTGYELIEGRKRT